MDQTRQLLLGAPIEVVPERRCHVRPELHHLKRSLVSVAIFCAIIQIVSATWIVESFDSPNAANEIAVTMLETGKYQGGNWQRLKGPEIGNVDSELRYFHLPVEPLLLTMAFRVLPPGFHPYIHVPIAVVLVIAASLVAAVIGGPKLALVTGTWISIQPFIVIHGPVWDDTFLSAALSWLLCAILLSRAKAEVDRSSNDLVPKPPLQPVVSVPYLLWRF